MADGRLQLERRMQYACPMSNAEARRDVTHAQAQEAQEADAPTGLAFLPMAAVAGASLAAAGALWWRFGEGVYGQALLNAVIACF